MGTVARAVETVRFRRSPLLRGVEIMDADWSPRNWRVFNVAFSFVLFRNWRGEASYRGRRHLVGPGFGFYTEPGETHSTPRIHMPGCFNVLMIEPETFHESLRDWGIDVKAAHLAKVTSCMSFTLKDSFVTFSRIIDRPESATHAQSCFTDLMAAIAAELVEGASARRERCDTSGMLAARIREGLHANGATIGLEAVATEIKVSRFQALRAFRRRYGLSPHQYQLALRIGRARRLLTAGAPLAEVAAECGFADQSHFTRQFKRQLGVTPGAYALRRQLTRASGH
jgi:AraC-like DNA-binding protein